ncbi:MAG: NAD(P)-dependent oxidoreductase [Paracoccus denitrificans]|nr:MAG: NAD(P)-dependent oxidoreductase [Paracoccus denitrificans]PZO85606.1 MAG: NAD(P)-dependent oxidoreductase [Paracoccus denitrificans]
MKLVTLGHGYSAGFLTRLLVAQGWDVVGTTRRDGQSVTATGARALNWTGDAAQITAELANADAILISAAPDADGDPALRDFRDAIAASKASWIGYLSTTGVYGDRGGDWVDESATLTPTTPRGDERVRAELSWRTLAEGFGLPLHIFRLAGIYGPGRGPLEKMRSGQARRIVKPEQVFSRIHAEDIAQVLAASIARPNPGAVYNVCDDDPAPPQDVLAYASELLGVPVPPEEDFATAELSPMARSFYAENKRVRNDRIKSELGVQLKYPDYRSGLFALVSGE